MRAMTLVEFRGQLLRISCLGVDPGDQIQMLGSYNVTDYSTSTFVIPLDAHASTNLVLQRAWVLTFLCVYVGESSEDSLQESCFRAHGLNSGHQTIL